MQLNQDQINAIKKLIVLARELEDQRFYYEERNIENSNSCSREYYDREYEANRITSTKNHMLIYEIEEYLY